MSRNRIIAVLALALAVFCAVCLFYQPSGSPQQIAQALIELQQQWEANGYKQPDTPPPKLLGTSSANAAVAGRNAAGVTRRHKVFGIEWVTAYQMERTEPTESVWTLYSTGFFLRPRDRRLDWKRRLITVTNTPSQLTQPP